MLKETNISHLIKPEDLQHHGTLFAGQMAKWFVEACFVAANRLVMKPEDIVCVQIHGLHFIKPARNGDIIDIHSRVAYVGKSSVTVNADVFINEDDTPAVSGMVTYVTVDKEGRPYSHGFTLPEEYIDENHEIYHRARRARGLES